MNSFRLQRSGPNGKRNNEIYHDRSKGNGGGDVGWLFGYPKIWGLWKRKERREGPSWLPDEFFLPWGNMAGRSCLATARAAAAAAAETW